jgi:hypothetical protein
MTLVVINFGPCVEYQVVWNVFTRNPHPAPGTQQAEQASLTHE